MSSSRRVLLKRSGKVLAGTAGLTAGHSQTTASQENQETEVELKAPAAPAENFDKIGNRDYVDAYGVSFPSAGRSFGGNYETLVVVPRTRYFSPGSDGSRHSDDDDVQEIDVGDAIQIDIYPFENVFDYVNSDAEQPIWDWDRGYPILSGFKMTEGSTVHQNGEFKIYMKDVTVGPAIEFDELLEKEYIGTMLVSKS